MCIPDLHSDVVEHTRVRLIQRAKEIHSIKKLAGHIRVTGKNTYRRPFASVILSESRIWPRELEGAGITGVNVDDSSCCGTSDADGAWLLAETGSEGAAGSPEVGEGVVDTSAGGGANRRRVRARLYRLCIDISI